MSYAVTFTNRHGFSHTEVVVAESIFDAAQVAKQMFNALVTKVVPAS